MSPKVRTLPVSARIDQVLGTMLNQEEDLCPESFTRSANNRNWGILGLWKSHLVLFSFFAGLFIRVGRPCDQIHQSKSRPRFMSYFS